MSRDAYVGLVSLDPSLIVSRSVLWPPLLLTKENPTCPRLFDYMFRITLTWRYFYCMIEPIENLLSKLQISSRIFFFAHGKPCHLFLFCAYRQRKGPVMRERGCVSRKAKSAGANAATAVFSSSRSCRLSTDRSSKWKRPAERVKRVHWADTTIRPASSRKVTGNTT